MSADPRAIERLAKICGMFGSDQLGERAAAAHRAETIRQQLGVSWADLLGGTVRPQEQPLPSFDPMTANPAAIAARCGPILTEWEREFLASVSSQRVYSPRQLDRLQVVRVKCATWWKNMGGDR